AADGRGRGWRGWGGAESADHFGHQGDKLRDLLFAQRLLDAANKSVHVRAQPHSERLALVGEVDADDAAVSGVALATDQAAPAQPRADPGLSAEGSAEVLGQLEHGHLA